MGRVAVLQLSTICLGLGHVLLIVTEALKEEQKQTSPLGA